MKSAPTETLQTLAQEIIKVAPDGWARITLKASAATGTLRSRLSADLYDGSVDSLLELDFDGEDACMKLREQMYDLDSGVWYNAIFVVSASGDIEADFDYTNPPLNGDPPDDLMKRDQARFPRLVENLPDWHPSKNS